MSGLTRHLRGLRRQALAVPVHAVLIAGMLYAVLPLLWALSTSLKSITEVSAYPPRWIPKILYFGNYVEAFAHTKFTQYIGNSILVVLAVTILTVVLAGHAAYASVRYPFRGRAVMLFIMLATSMIPTISTIVPLYMLSVQVNLYDTKMVLILVFSAWLVPSLVWLLRGFVDAIPRELEEAALIDGCTPLSAIYRIDVPLMLPGLMAAAVLVFVTIWNDFLWAFALTLSDGNRLVQVGLYFFITEAQVEWGPLMAATVMTLLPIVVAFAIMQRAFIRGLTSGAVIG